MFMCRISELEAAAGIAAVNEKQSAAIIISLQTQIASLESSQTVGEGTSDSSSEVRISDH